MPFSFYFVARVFSFFLNFHEKPVHTLLWNGAAARIEYNLHLLSQNVHV